MAPERMVVIDSLHRLRRPRLHGRRRRQRASSAAPTSRARSPPRRRCARTCKIIVMVDTLEYLRRGGRIGAARAWIGATLKVKPILTIEGEMQPVERVRTAGRAFERLVAHLEQRREDGCDGFAIQHVQARRRGRAPGRARPRDLRARPGADLGDRPGDRHPHRPGHPRRHRPAAPSCSARCLKESAAAGWNPRRGGRPARSSEPPRRAAGRRRSSRPARRGSIVRTLFIAVAVRDLAVPDLPAAQADRLGADRDVPGRRAVGPGQPAQPVHAARLRDHDRLPRACC